MTYKLTVDSNLMAPDLKVAGMETLKKWRDEGKIDLIEADTPRLVKNEAYGWPGAPPKKPEVKQSPWGGPRGRPKKMNESGNANFKSVAAVLFPSKDPGKLNMGEVNNVAHLIKHHSSKNEFFITGNKDFIEGGHRETLKAYFGIIVMTPEEVVSALVELNGWTDAEVKKPKAAAGRAKKSTSAE